MSKIFIYYADKLKKNTIDLLEKSDISNYLKSNMKVTIKPNLVLAKEPSEGATTHPEIIEGIILFLQDKGVRDIKIMESSWVGDDTKRAYKICGYEYLKEKYKVDLVDLKDDKTIVVKTDYGEINVCESILKPKTDFLIDVPVLKAHCQTSLTCCMKNLKGCIPDSEKRRFHSLGIHRPVALVTQIIKPAYCVVDGICGDLTFEEGGNPVLANRIIAGKNPLTVDSYCAELIGYKADEIEYLSFAKKLGLGEYFAEEDIIEFNKEFKPKISLKSNNGASRYKDYINESAACSACYSSLIFALHRSKNLNKKDKINIGQGFRGKKLKGLGIGNCTAGCEKYVKGCPPKAIDIINQL